MSYTNYFADALTAEAERDTRVVAVHAAMAGGTGLTRWVHGRRLSTTSLEPAPKPCQAGL